MADQTQTSEDEPIPKLETVIDLDSEDYARVHDAVYGNKTSRRTKVKPCKWHCPDPAHGTWLTYHEDHKAAASTCFQCGAEGERIDK